MSANIVKVTLEQTHPPVWRRIALPEKITYRDFHEILQIAFGWDNYHLHNFSSHTPASGHPAYETNTSFSADHYHCVLDSVL